MCVCVCVHVCVSRNSAKCHEGEPRTGTEWNTGTECHEGELGTGTECHEGELGTVGECHEENSALGLYWAECHEGV